VLKRVWLILQIADVEELKKVLQEREDQENVRRSSIYAWL
jgi:hypothetical protein